MVTLYNNRIILCASLSLWYMSENKIFAKHTNNTSEGIRSFQVWLDFKVLGNWKGSKMRIISDVTLVVLLQMNTSTIITYCREGGGDGVAALLKCFLHLAHLPLTAVWWGRVAPVLSSPEPKLSSSSIPRSYTLPRLAEIGRNGKKGRQPSPPPNRWSHDPHLKQQILGQLALTTATQMSFGKKNIWLYK
jgi:hypothetical protein